MKILLVSRLQVKSVFRRLSRQGLTRNSSKQTVAPEEETFNSKIIKILLNIVVLSNLREGISGALEDCGQGKRHSVCVPWSV